MTPSNGSPEIVWQVFLGCNNAWRLAKKLRISKGRAYRRLSRALDAGLIERVGRGHYAVKNKKTTVRYVCGIRSPE